MKRPNFVRSPFKLEYDNFLNYYNNHQVYFMEGDAEVENFDRFIEIVQK